MNLFFSVSINEILIRIFVLYSSELICSVSLTQQYTLCSCLSTKIREKKVIASKIVYLASQCSSLCQVYCNVRQWPGEGNRDGPKLFPYLLYMKQFSFASKELLLKQIYVVSFFKFWKNKDLKVYPSGATGY
jgi:hypothetical protein